MPLVYEELRRLAHHYMRLERAGHTLQTSALINKAYLRLIDQQNVRWQNREHFFGIAAQLMRRILIDHARSHLRAKRGAGARGLSFNEAALVSEERAVGLVALDDALKSLATIDARKSQVVELRFFGGFNTVETAEVMEMSPRTVEREWNLARAWLRREISNES